jgi:apolipoprotein N-acyltransferase
VFGTLRLAGSERGQLAVAAVGTDATFDGTSLPTPVQRARTLDRLLADTHAAASAGAKLAVWNEAAALVMPEEEGAFVLRVQEAALRDHVHVVAAYIVPKSTDPLRFENKYRWLRPDGTIDHTYFKHHPAPGEPAVVGRGALPIVSSELGRLGGGLCYDYDFPAFAREHGRAQVDLVALPSSDWRGIDPIHTQMAALRAIEQGVSIVRSTRFGLSAAIDPTGRMRALHSSFDGGSRVMLAQLPDESRATLYRHTGDVLVYAGFALLAFMALRIAARGRRLRAASERPMLAGHVP